jgi:hypothetical protein
MVVKSIVFVLGGGNTCRLRSTWRMVSIGCWQVEANVVLNWGSSGLYVK